MERLIQRQPRSTELPLGEGSPPTIREQKRVIPGVPFHAFLLHGSPLFSERGNDMETILLQVALTIAGTLTSLAAAPLRHKRQHAIVLVLSFALVAVISYWLGLRSPVVR